MPPVWINVKETDYRFYVLNSKSQFSQMKPRRIHITGASGSGTTTLGEALGRRLAWQHADADNYYWLPTVPPYQKKRAGDERLQMILQDLKAAGSSVLSGAIINWGQELEDSFDLIVYLHIPPELRLQRLRAREIQRHGKVNEEFITWAALYDEGDLTVRSKQRVMQWLDRRTAPVLRLEGDMTVAARLEAVLAQL